MPPAEVAITVSLVRGLLRSQAPDLAALPIAAVGGHGWDNAVFRLGADLAVRLPRRAAAAPLVALEMRWLPELAPRLPLPVPVPLRVGEPELGYPWHWTICRWVPGEPVGTSGCDPAALAGFLVALHQPAPADAPHNPARGIPLVQRDDRLRDGARLLAAAGRDVAPILRAWERLASADAYVGPPVWLHGDFHTANILHHGGRVSAVIDFGDVTGGDPACDFLVAWLLTETAPLREAAQRHGSATWQRAQAWALAWGVAAVSQGADNPFLRAIGERAIAAAVRPDW